MSEDTLDKMIAERKELLKRISNFIANICNERGERISYEECSDHTRGEYELRNFFDFSFFLDWGWAEYYRVVYHTKEGDKNVLNFICQAGEYEVTLFSNESSWLEALNKLIENKDEMIAEMEKEKENDRKKFEEVNARITARSKQISEAVKLGIKL